MAELKLGRVDPEAVLAWCDNALDILASLRQHAEHVPFQIPAETMRFLDDLITGWREISANGGALGAQQFDDEHTRQLVTYWFNITKLTEDERRSLGISFTPPAGRAFADSLAAAVAEAMAASPALLEFASRLEAAWRSCQPAFGTAARPLS